MQTIEKNIFGNNVKLEIEYASTYNILADELKHYAIAVSEAHTITIRDRITTQSPVLSNNPSSFSCFKNGFQSTTRLIRYNVYFENNRVVLIEFEILEKKGLKTILRKWNDMQFTNRHERIGQILHESILIPILLLQRNRLLIHASGICNQNNEVTLFGGTGGVGKTSIELLACFKNSEGFICDDIAVLNGKSVYRNLNYPKIYAYNVEGYPLIRKKLFQRFNIINRVFWRFKLLQGKNKVRRRVNPISFFDTSKKLNESKLKNYVILKRSDVISLQLNTIELDQAAEASWEIILSEFTDFFKTINFLKLNSIYNQINICNSIDSLESNYIKEFKESFSSAKLYSLDIPLHIKHSDFITEVEKVLKAEELIK